jgi:hypothetical protein
MYGIVKDIPKPDIVAAPGASKYPLAQMEVGDSFIVPYAEMKEGEDAQAFRKRINQSVRNYALRDYSNRREKMAEAVKKEFTVAVMPEDDKSEAKRFVQGDVVVWRDA